MKEKWIQPLLFREEYNGRPIYKILVDKELVDKYCYGISSLDKIGEHFVIPCVKVIPEDRANSSWFSIKLLNHSGSQGRLWINDEYVIRILD